MSQTTIYHCDFCGKDTTERHEVWSIEFRVFDGYGRSSYGPSSQRHACESCTTKLGLKKPESAEDMMQSEKLSLEDLIRALVQDELRYNNG